MASLTLTTAPSIEPLLVADLRAHLKVDDGEEQFLLDAWLTAARQQVEIYTGVALLTQTWLLQLDGFPADDFVTLPRAPVQSIASVQYVDQAGTTQTMSAGDYRLVAPEDPVGGEHRLVLGYGKSWPSTRSDINSVSISFIAGFADRKSVPPALLAAILLIAGDLYENREAQIVRDAFNPNPTLARLMAPYRRRWVG